MTCGSPLKKLYSYIQPKGGVCVCVFFFFLAFLVECNIDFEQNSFYEH